MKLKVGDDGELEYIDLEEKPKRKRKPGFQRSLRGCLQIAVFAVFFILSFVGGFGLYFVRNPNSMSMLQGSYMHNVCAETIPTMNVSGAKVAVEVKDEITQTAAVQIYSMDGVGETYMAIKKAVTALAFSPNQKSVLVTRDEAIYPYEFIYSWNMDGAPERSERILTDGTLPSWSPDGTKIAFFRQEGEEHTGLYVMNADGSQMHLVQETYYVTYPASWSPDGTQLVFASTDYSHQMQRTQNLYIVNIQNGSERILLENGLSAVAPAWSPDGKRIAYITHDVYTINVDGSDRHNVTNGSFGNIYSVGWSPDSATLVLFAQAATTYRQGIYVMDSDGAGLHTLYQVCA